MGTKMLFPEVCCQLFKTRLPVTDVRRQRNMLFLPHQPPADSLSGRQPSVISILKLAV